MHALFAAGNAISHYPLTSLILSQEMMILKREMIGIG